MHDRGHAADVYFAFKLQFGYLALLWACTKGHVDVVKVLLAAGANIEASDHVGGVVICEGESKLPFIGLEPMGLAHGLEG